MAFSRTLIRALSRRMTLPQLSPTHSQSRILKWEIENGSTVHAYDPVMVVECSMDMITAPYRDGSKMLLVVDTQDEGMIRDLKTYYLNQWIPIGTELGIIDDGEPVDGEWLWQAYTTDTVDTNKVVVDTSIPSST
jgi:pyruvate/2-oxoglutarate dehydrogenase complex dihydrolipoamide acyltransferase (E2) component